MIKPKNVEITFLDFCCKDCDICEPCIDDYSDSYRPFYTISCKHSDACYNAFLKGYHEKEEEK